MQHPVPPLTMLVLLLSACGGPPSEQVTTTTANRSGPADPDEEPLHTQIPLEAGELALGAEGPEDSHVAVAVRGKNGLLVLDGCFTLEARTLSGPFELGEAHYEKAGASESLSAHVPRRLLERLARESKPEIVTCDEVLPLDERGVRILRHFLAGRVNVPEVTYDSRSVTLFGVRLQARISSAEPDTLELLIQFEEGTEPPDPCGPLVGMVGDRAFALGSTDELGREEAEDLDATFRLKVPVKTFRWLAVGEDAGIGGCGDPWMLDPLILENLRGLVGRPEAGESPPKAVKPR